MIQLKEILFLKFEYGGASLMILYLKNQINRTVSQLNHTKKFCVINEDKKIVWRKSPFPWLAANLVLLRIKITKIWQFKGCKQSNKRMRMLAVLAGACLGLDLGVSTKRKLSKMRIVPHPWC